MDDKEVDIIVNKVYPRPSNEVDEHFECLCSKCKMTSQMCRHRVTGPSKPSTTNSMNTMDSMVPFRSVIVKLDDLHDVTVKDDIVYTGKFPLGVLWFMNKDYVEVQNASFIKITNPSPAYTFDPDWTSKPGDTIVDCLKEREMSLTEFAEKMNISIVYIGRIIDGSTPINKDIAERLSEVLGSTSEFWVEREKQYRLQVKHESGN